MPERHLLPADLFPRYTRLRRGSMSVDEALEQLAASARTLTLVQQQTLARMIASWETHTFSPTEPGAPAQSPDAELPCPNCGTVNEPGMYYCASCGHSLPGPPDTKRLGGQYDFMDEGPHVGTSYFGERMKLVLVPQSGEPLEVDTPVGRDVIIGRVSTDPVVAPDIDLTPFDAEALGVSRLHVAVRWQENTLTITDLGSTNYTYINGQRLYPQELRALRDGEELRLGRMVLRVRFRIEDQT